MKNTSTNKMFISQRRSENSLFTAALNSLANVQ